MFIFVLLALVHTVVHEIGHVLATHMVGAKVKKIGIDKRGPHIVRTPAATPLRNALVSLGGPAINITTGLILLAYRVPHAELPILFGVFNLLPFPHSDGVHAWKAIQGDLYWHGNVLRSTKS